MVVPYLVPSIRPPIIILEIRRKIPIPSCTHHKESWTLNLVAYMFLLFLYSSSDCSSFFSLLIARPLDLIYPGDPKT